MGITKTGKCVICRVKVREHRDFEPQLNLFGAPPTGITQEMQARIVAWRDEPILCEVHAPHRANLRLVAAHA